MSKSNSVSIRRQSQRQAKYKSTEMRLDSLSRITQIVRKKSEAMDASKEKLRKAREHLERCMAKVRKQESKLRRATQQFKIETTVLKEASNDIRELYTFPEKDQTMINFHAILTMEDTLVGERQIKRIENELENMSPIVQEEDPDFSTVARCYDRVQIPEPEPVTTRFLFKPKPARECCICLKYEASSVIIDCGHCCMCRSCSYQLADAPPNEDAETDDRLCPCCRKKTTLIAFPKVL